MRKLVLLVAIGCFGLWTVVPANAQQPGPGVIMPGDHGRWHGYMPDGYIGSYRHANALAQRTTTQNGTVPRFCYSLRTGRFTHWGECRIVTLPNGQRVKVAH